MAKDFPLAARRKIAEILCVLQDLTTTLPAEKTSQISQVIYKQFLRLGDGTLQGKAEDAGGLSPVKDGNEALRRSGPKIISGRMEH